MKIKLSKIEARNLMLLSQGLFNTPKRKASKEDLLKAIINMGQLQIDTIHVVARSPYLVLWSRLGNYDSNWLDDLLSEGKLFEYWSHAMCFLPIEDYPLYRRLALDKKGHWGARTEKWFGENAPTIKTVIEHITKVGETRSSDFERSDSQKSGWWNWKAEKVALEVLFDRGDLMIARREKFQRIYNLRQRILPTWSDNTAPPYVQVQETLAIKALGALGVATSDWLANYFYTPKRDMPKTLARLVQKKEIFEVDIEDIGKAYIHKNNLKNINKIVKLKPSLTTFLSPFDPLVNNRKRALSIFNFAYQIECYTPAPKRKYGYFTLPILYKGNLVGRLDPKAHRKLGVFEVKSIHLEKGIKITSNLVTNIAKALQNFASWHKTPTIKITKSDPKELRALLLPKN